MMVVDAAVTVDFLLDLAADAEAVRDRLARESLPWAAAELLDAEVAHVIRRRILRGELSSSDAMAALSGLTAMEIDRHSHRALLLARALGVAPTPRSIRAPSRAGRGARSALAHP